MIDEFELIRRYFTRPPPAKLMASLASSAPTSSDALASSNAPVASNAMPASGASGLASAVLGIGDDCALLAPRPGFELALSTDMLVEGHHFFAGTDPQRLGHKTLAVNLSDCAAVGATPRYALLAGALPDADPGWLSAFSHGLFDLADQYGVELIGGDTTRGPRVLCVTIIGEVPAGQALLRSGAKAGDAVWVSGELGSAAAGLALLQSSMQNLAPARGAVDPEKSAGSSTMDLAQSPITEAERADAVAALERPQPRVALGVALRNVATSAIDISDGLVGDLGHILERSNAGAEIELARIPCRPWIRALLGAADTRAAALRWIIAGGDDYELCFTAPAARNDDVLAAGRAAGVAVTPIGRIVEGNALQIFDEQGERLPHAGLRAFDHFARSR